MKRPKPCVKNSIPYSAAIACPARASASRASSAITSLARITGLAR